MRNGEGRAFPPLPARDVVESGIRFGERVGVRGQQELLSSPLNKAETTSEITPGSAFIIHLLSLIILVSFPHPSPLPELHSGSDHMNWRGEGAGSSLFPNQLLDPFSDLVPHAAEHREFFLLCPLRG